MSDINERILLEINELNKKINEQDKKIDKNAEIGRASHRQTKGCLSKLEERIAELEGGGGRAA